MKHLETLRASLQEKEQALTALQAKENLTEDDLTSMEKLIGEIETVRKQIATVEKAAKLTASASKPADGSEKNLSLPAQPKEEPEKFKSFGEQLQAIAGAGINKGHEAAVDRRLVWKAPTGAGEGVASDGGFLVQQDYSTQLLELMHEMGQVLSRVTRLPLSSNSNGIKLPTIDETSRVNGSRWGGVNAYWSNEADTAAASKPKFGEIELSLKKLMGVSYATEELLRDASVLETIFRKAFTEELTFKTEEAICVGTGSGQMLGFMNSGALISVAAESGQAAATIVTQNILNMISRMPPRSFLRSVWLINQDILPQLYPLTIGNGTATHLIYAPPGLTGDNKNAPFGTLMGRPVLPIEHAATLGTTGDITLVDLGTYLMIDKGGMDWSESMHVRFLYDEMTFKITYRVDGQPSVRKAITPKNGTATVSPYVALATRN